MQLYPKCVIENARFEISNRTSMCLRRRRHLRCLRRTCLPQLAPTLLSENVQMMLWALMLVASLLVAFYVMRQRGQSTQGTDVARRWTAGEPEEIDASETMTRRRRMTFACRLAGFDA